MRKDRKVYEVEAEEIPNNDPEENPLEGLGRRLIKGAIDGLVKQGTEELKRNNLMD